MPTYVYEVISTGEQFEVIQSIHDHHLTHHPETGQPVQRVYVPAYLGIKHTPGSTKQLLSNESLAKAGFQKYEKDKLTGAYNKVV